MPSQLDETKSIQMSGPAQIVSPLSRLRAGAGAGAVVVGISGGRRNPSAAVAVGGRLLGFCEQERLTRIRGTRLSPGQLPADAVNAALKLAGEAAERVCAYVVAEEGVSIGADLPSLRLDHHQ